MTPVRPDTRWIGASLSKDKCVRKDAAQVLAFGFEERGFQVQARGRALSLPYHANILSPPVRMKLSVHTGVGAGG